MPKIIALHHPAAGLAAALAAKGYRTVSLQEARRFRLHIDAILYSARLPETGPAFHSGLEAADISVGHARGENMTVDAMPGAIMLNITGLHPAQVAAEVEQRLQYRHWRT